MHGTEGEGFENVTLAKKRKKKKKKRVQRKEYEDPSLREHLLAGAYGGIAKPKPKRQGVKYTTNIDSGLRDIATPNAIRMEARRNPYPVHGSLSGLDALNSSRKMSRPRGTGGGRSNYDKSE